MKTYTIDFNTHELRIITSALLSKKLQLQRLKDLATSQLSKGGLSLQIKDIGAIELMLLNTDFYHEEPA